MDAYFTNKAPGGIAYRCSFRVTEASYAIERGMDILADELGMDAVELRRKNFIRKDQFPYPSALGFTYDSGDYHKTLDIALEKIGYAALLKEQAEKRARGELMGIGFSTFTEVVGAGPSKHFDILGIKMFDSAEIRIHPDRRRHRAHRREVAGAGARDDLGADRRRGAGARSADTSWSRKATPTRRRTASAPTRAAARRSPAPRSRWPRAASARRRARSPRTCSRSARPTSSGPTTSSR